MIRYAGTVNRPCPGISISMESKLMVIVIFSSVFTTWKQNDTTLFCDYNTCPVSNWYDLWSWMALHDLYDLYDPYRLQNNGLWIVQWWTAWMALHDLYHLTVYRSICKPLFQHPYGSYRLYNQTTCCNIPILTNDMQFTICTICKPLFYDPYRSYGSYK